MSMPSTVAYDVLGLPTFASVDDIILRYRILAAWWYPENNNNCAIAIEQFKIINEAAATLLYPEEAHEEPMKLLDMYQLFQNLFFGVTENVEYESDYENEDGVNSLASDLSTDDEATAEFDQIKASINADKLILEEEQEKLKAEKKRAKKKRRKERKKKQKVETEVVQKQNPKEKQSSKPSKESKAKEIIEEKLSDIDEGIDPNSAFVAVIAKKHKNIAVAEPKTKNENSNPFLPNEIKEDPSAVVLRSRQLALRANEMATLGHYSEAVNLFSESIKLDPSDHRFYGNRSYCYDRLGQFERALKDADKSVTLCPSWPKGYFRRGRALLGLKRYAEAEECFVQVLKLDNDCKDAISELHKVKILQIMELGYTKQQAESALANHSSVQESIESLLADGVSKIKTTDEIEVFISDDESDGFFSHTSKPSQSPQYDVKMDPRNPESHNSLWIGNVQPGVTEKKLVSLFSKYGELLSIKVMPEKFCAFVNYKNKNAPGKAMQAYQGLELHGNNLLIRFPKLPGEAEVKKKPAPPPQDPSKAKSSDECYFWRTTGCVYGDNCRYRHVKEHKGVDKKKWHVVS